MNKVGIIILNYMNYRETIRCVDSVLLQENVRFEIVIVDNGSKNESYKELIKKYGNNRLIHILKVNKNYGFAKGNNVGINYAKSKLSVKFILILNSDTELIEKDYVYNLISAYKKDIAVIGSHIIQKSGLKQEKFYDYVKFPETLYFFMYLLCNYHGFITLSEILLKMLQRYKKTEIIHGSCFMLTPSFFDHYKLLYNKTFLYSEEILLYIYCENAGLKQIIVEEASILHKGKQSSKYLYANKASVKNKYLLVSYKYVVWESLKAYIKKYFVKRSLP